MELVYEPLPGNDRVAAMLAPLAARLGDMTPGLAAVVETVRATERARFRTGAYGTWKPLAASTLAGKLRDGYPPDILVRTGRLAAAAGGGTRDSVVQISPDSATVGVTVPYAHFHQTGGWVPGRPPQRKIYDATPALALRIAGVLQAYLAGGGEAALAEAKDAGA